MTAKYDIDADEDADEITPAVEATTEFQALGRVTLFNQISLAMINTDEPLSDDEHDELMSHYRQVFYIDKLPLKYIKWIRKAEIRLYDRLGREGMSLQDYYFESQLGPVGVPSVDDYES